MSVTLFSCQKIENAMRCNFINFYHVGKDRWDYLEQDGYRKLSTVLQKSKDIEKFNVDLEKVYSIKLSDERVLWENPDKLSTDANTLPNNEGRKA